VTDSSRSKHVSDNCETGSLPFLADVPELLRVRVLPAEFARLVGVSKQSVSRWLKAGKLTPTFDGKIDVHRGVQQILRNTDPGQLRARVLRQAVADVQELRDAVAAVEEREAAIRAKAEAREAELRGRIQVLEQFADRLGRTEDVLVDLVLDHVVDAGLDLEAWEPVLDRLRREAWEASAEAPAEAAPSTSGTPLPAPVDEWAEAVALAAELGEPVDVPDLYGQ